MEFKMQSVVTTPKEILFNYDELKNWIVESTKQYEGLVYTDDQIKTAKSDRAGLNKLKKALNDERIKFEKEYMAPCKEFKARVDELIALIDKPVAMIDAQIKEYEAIKQEEKIKAAANFFEAQTDRPEWLRFEQIMDKTWGNASMSMNAVENGIRSRIESVNNQLEELEKFPYHAFEAVEYYKQNINFQDAIGVARKLHEMDEAKAKFEAEQARKVEKEAAQTKDEAAPVEIPTQNDAERAVVKDVNPQTAREWVNFSAYLSVPEARALAQYFNERGIKFKAI